MASPYSIQQTTIVEARILMSYQEQRCMNVLHYTLVPGSTADPDGTGAVQALANSLAGVGAGSLMAAYKAATVPGLRFDRVECQVVSPLRWAKRFALLSFNGGFAGDGVPSNLAADITTITDLPGHRGSIPHVGGNGIQHIPAAPLEVLDGNKWQQTYVDDFLIPLADKLLSQKTVGANVWQRVLWHRKDAAQPSFTAIVNTDASIYVRTMRRRGALLGI